MPVFNRRERTLACIAQLKAQTRVPDRIIIADGGSTDGTCEAVREAAPDVVVLTAPEEYFWGGSMAQGIDHVLSQRPADDDLLMMMNDDTILPDDYVETMADVCLGEWAAIGAATVDAHQRQRVIDAGVYIHWQPYGFRSATEVPVRFRDDIDTLPGRGTILPIGMVRAVDNVDAAAFPHYLCDYDFFLRIRKAGFRLGITGRTWIGTDMRATGISAQTSPCSVRAALRLAFSRRSKENIVDHLRFVLRHAPTMGLKIGLIFWLAWYHLRLVIRRLI